MDRTKFEKCIKIDEDSKMIEECLKSILEDPNRFRICKSCGNNYWSYKPYRISNELLVHIREEAVNILRAKLSKLNSEFSNI